MLSINNTTEGYLKNIEIKGNTIQDSLGTGDLADIKSVGDKIEGQEMYEIPLLCTGKNLDLGVELKNSFRPSVNGRPHASSSHNGHIAKVKGNTQYKCHGKGGKLSNFCFFDVNMNYLGGVASPIDMVVETPATCRFLTYAVSHTIVEVQIEEGTVTTSYQPYTSHKITILSPVQLEKVGDVSDRIVERDGVWGVEKNNLTLVLDGSRKWLKREMYFDYLDNTYTHLQSILSSRYKEVSYAEWDKGNQVIGIDFIYGIRVRPNNFENMTVNDFVLDLKNSPCVVKYNIRKDDVPTFIPLPHDQQVKLRTFANRTNISFLCDVEGTIKADVPKSLGATVNTHTTQIDSINKELERVKKLEESTVSTVVTESDFTVVEQTNQGYFEDVELKGRTLVNYGTHAVNDYTLKDNSNCKIVDYDFEPNKVYTLGVYFSESSVTSNNSNDIFLCQTVLSSGINIRGKEAIGWVFRKITTEAIPPNYWTIGARGSLIGTVKVSKFLILEGDHTQNPPQYFEGLASVGDGTDELVVSSVNDGSLFEIANCVSGLLGEYTGTISPNASYSTSDYIEIKKGERYFLRGFNTWYSCYYDNSKNFISQIKINEDAFMAEFDGYARFSLLNTNIEKATIGFSKNSIIGKKVKVDKKKLLYFDPTDSTWKKPILREWDIVKDSKYTQGSGEVILTGDEDITIESNQTMTNTVYFAIKGYTPELYGKKIICNEFINRDVFGKDYEGINFEGSATTLSGLRIRISKTKADTLDKFKAWLKANPVTIVYQLATPKVYECTNLDLITYPNETNFTVRSGVLSPKATLKVHSNISNVVSLLQKKVSLLESNMSKYMVTQNRLMLDSRYSADSVTFKVDYPSMANEKITELDYDLFNLLKANVLVGKDNYNYEKMINKIDFYQSIGMIDWDMWDEIWLIMEFQHNPPVEEIPEETPEI